MNVRVWPTLGIRAYQTKHGGAFRLYCLIRANDEQGRGYISIENLKQYAQALNINPKTLTRWLKDGIKCGMFAQTQKGICVRSQEGIMQIVGAMPDKFTVTIPLNKLFKKGWHALLLASFHKANFGKQISKKVLGRKTQYTQSPVSQKTIEDLTGIKVSTQKSKPMHRYIKSVRQVAIHPNTGQLEYASPNKYFVFRDHKDGHKLKIAKFIPSKKFVDNKNASIAGRGRKRTIEAALTGQACDNLPLSFIPQAGCNATVRRLYYSTKKEQGKAIRLSQGIALKNDPIEIYVQLGRGNTWESIPLRKSSFFCENDGQNIDLY